MKTIRVSSPKAPKRSTSVSGPGEPPIDAVPKSDRIPSMAPTVGPANTRDYGKPPYIPGRS